MTASENLTEDVADLSFEQARDQLVQVVAQLEQGAPTLEESLTLWERGEALADRCEKWLLGAQQRLDRSPAETGRETDAGARGDAPDEDPS